MLLNGSPVEPGCCHSRWTRVHVGRFPPRRQALACAVAVHEAAACVGSCSPASACWLVVPKLGPPRRERRFHDRGVDISQGVLGPEGTLRPPGGFVRGGEAIEFAQKPIAQRGRSVRSKGLLGRRPWLAVLRKGAKGSRCSPGRAVSVGFSPIDDVSPLSRVGWLSREIRRVEIILSGNSRSRPMLCSFVATPCRNNGSSRPKFPLNREINREFAESGLKCDGLVFNHLGRSMACARIPCTTERRIVLR